MCSPDVSASFAFFRCRRPMKALLEAAFFGCDEMLLRFVGLAEHFGQMLDGADEIVFFAQTAVEFHVERADRLAEPGNWIALIELFRKDRKSTRLNSSH